MENQEKAELMEKGAEVLESLVIEFTDISMRGAFINLGNHFVTREEGKINYKAKEHVSTFNAMMKIFDAAAGFEVEAEEAAPQDETAAAPQEEEAAAE